MLENEFENELEMFAKCDGIVNKALFVKNSGSTDFITLLVRAIKSF